MKKMILLFASAIFILTSCQETYSLDTSSYNHNSALLVYDMSGLFSSILLLLIFIVLVIISSILKKIYKELQISNGTDEKTVTIQKTYSQLQEERKEKELNKK